MVGEVGSVSRAQQLDGPCHLQMTLWLLSFVAMLCCTSGKEMPDVGNVTDVTIHMALHSHDDVGWQVSVGGYYLPNQYHTAVRQILSDMLSGLEADPQRKMQYVEIAFFHIWWLEQSPENRAKFKALVNNGRMEFTNAGWCQNDEATAHYSDIIDNMCIGHLFIQAQFGSKTIPTVGFQADPFGHAATQVAPPPPLPPPPAAAFRGMWFRLYKCSLVVVVVVYAVAL